MSKAIENLEQQNEVNKEKIDGIQNDFKNYSRVK